MIKFSPATGLMSRALIRYMDAECFPKDEPFEWKDAYFTIGEKYPSSEKYPACYCAWKPVEFKGSTVAFLYRAGVMPEFRGQGLQQKMIAIRENQIHHHRDIDFIITCTAVDNMASISSMQKSGYKIYSPSNGKLPDVAYEPSIHWYKEI